MKRKQSRILLGALVALSLTIAGCGGGGATSTADEGTSEAATASEGNIVTVSNADPETMIPGNSWGFQFNVLVFSSLMKINEEGVPELLVAKEVVSEDNQVWDITLNEGWTFHNGEPVTAQSYADAWNATAYGPNAWVQNSYFSLIEGYEEMNPLDGSTPEVDTLSGVEVISDLELRVTLTEPNGLFPYTLANPATSPLPEVAFEDLDAFSTAAIGNGPYRLADGYSYIPKEPVELQRYEDYAGRPANVEFLTLVPYEDYSTAYNDVLAGNLDVLYPVPQERLADLENSFPESNAQSTIPNLNFLAFPAWDPQWENADLRYAISMAIDRETLTQTILQGSGAPAYSMAPESAAGARPDSCEYCTYDPEEAKRLYDAAGGYEGTLTLMTTVWGNEDQVLQAIANQLKTNLGIEDIQFELSDTAYDDFFAQTGNGVYLGYWGAYFPHIQAMVEPFYSSTGANNLALYDNAEIDALIAEGDTLSGDEAIDFYNQAEDLGLAEMWYVPVYFGLYTAVWGDRVANVPMGPQGFGDLTTIEMVE